MKKSKESYVKLVKMEASNIDVLLPEVKFFIDKIENNQSFHFLRFNHGIIDLYCERYVMCDTKVLPFENFEKNLIEGNYKLLSQDLYHSTYFNTSHNNSVLTKKYFNSLLRLFHGYKGISDKLHISLSLGNGLGTIWGRWPEWNELQAARLRIVSFICNISKYKYYHSGVLKHFCLMDDHYKLFKSLNDNGFRVIVVGPEYMRLFKVKYDINDFLHIPITRIGAIDMMKDVINQINENKTEKTIIINSTGHIITAHLSETFLNTNVFLLDIGRSFDYDFKELIGIEKTLDKNGWHAPNQFDEKELIEHIKQLRNG